MSAYDARAAILILADQMAAQTAALSAHAAIVPTNAMMRITTADQTILDGYSAIVPVDYEVGSGFVTELAGSTSILEIGL